MADLPTNILSLPSGAIRKCFTPLENNPEIMSGLSWRLGLSRTVKFIDIYSIDESEIIAMIPRPCYGLLLVFPVNKASETFRTQEDKTLDAYDGFGEEEVIWFQQTIGTGCGIIALLHCLLNGKARSFVGVESDLGKLYQEILPMQPLQRANALCSSHALEIANELAAREGQSEVVAANTPMDLHFVCFTKSGTGNLWELDGRRKGPLIRGRLRADEDVLDETALNMGIRSFLKREAESGCQDLRFSLIGLVPAS
ncbi:ubiquitin carboxyl-terminal hydrolase [Aspergillus saccharolyticus JOP 1030-1]|uniref:Ubiquitin carboxyl-terminal hydrolase n=1 Tax=Aspergillus saccharolyticus JOP 1030-1 TaxID=1450539 RepID=A0A318ZT32_9EURO|nr:cysteine proteinase [Aspergillus saccharolyticus JOP 1030-1]PYH49804.1 cysteine proteinase [Aspergillus saccharolyticus JOP 1030-1]